VEAVHFEEHRLPPLQLSIIVQTPPASIMSAFTDRPQVRWDVHALIMELNELIVHFESRVTHADQSEVERAGYQPHAGMFNNAQSTTIHGGAFYFILGNVSHISPA
jgi:hypothetical protein